MKNVTPPHDRRPAPNAHAQDRGTSRRGASIVAGIALLPFVLIGLAVAGVALAVGLIWAAAWAIIVAVGGAFLVASVAAAVAILRAQQDRDGRPG